MRTDAENITTTTSTNIAHRAPSGFPVLGTKSPSAKIFPKAASASAAAINTPKARAFEVAVPYTSGTGAIFVPIRIVFSQSIPTAGLYRHGVAYIKPTLDS